MNICGIVAEYNPFHNGHAYLIKKARENGATHIAAAMSGDFVQRAAPAIVDKFARARAAVMCGVDLVIELPVQYATASAERFARGAVETLMALGCVDMLAFGSGSGSLESLERAADAVSDPALLERAKKLAEGGMSFAAAREKATRELFGHAVADVLDGPDNILATEYLKALRLLKCEMQPFTTERAGVSHDEKNPSGEFASASFVRAEYLSGGDIAEYLPEPSLAALGQARERGALSGGWQALERALLIKLRGMSASEWAALPDAGGGLGERLNKAAMSAASAEELFALAKTKRYAMARVRRVALCALLGITTEDFFPAPYIRVLAVGERGEVILREAKKSASLPLSHSLKKLETVNANCARTAELSARASDIYGLSLPHILPAGRDYTEKLFKKQ